MEKIEKLQKNLSFCSNIDSKSLNNTYLNRAPLNIIEILLSSLKNLCADDFFWSFSPKTN